MSGEETNQSTLEKKWITYSWDGGYSTIEIEPKIDLSYISPNNSEGVFDQDLSNCDLSGGNMKSSNFFKCDFRNSNLKNVKMDNKMELFGSDFRDAQGLNSYQISKIIQSGGILTDEHAGEYQDFIKTQKSIDKLNNEQQREIEEVKEKYNKKINKLKQNLESRFM